MCSRCRISRIEISNPEKLQGIYRMSSPFCPLCRNQRSEPRFVERGHTLWRCPDCGLFFIDPYPSENAGFRESVIDNSYEGGIESTDSDAYYQGEVNFYRHYFPLVEREIEGARRLLDVGCGTGRLLELLSKRRGLACEGIELNAARAELASKRASCPVHRIPVEQFAASEKYDIITFINVLSHIPWFDPVYGTIRSLLAEGGRFIMKTGELEPDVRRDDIYDWAIPVHVHFLGIETAEYIARKYGMRIIRHIRVPMADELYSPDRMKSPGPSSFRNRIKSMVARFPFILSLARRWYTMRHGTRIYSSYIVFTPE